MKRISILFLLSTVLCFTTGCAYMKDRALDFADCFKADIGYGYGLDINFRATNFITGGVGMGYGCKAGFKGRYPGVFQDIHIGIPISLFSYFCDDEPFSTDMAIIGFRQNGIFKLEKVGYEVDSIAFITCSFCYPESETRLDQPYDVLCDPVNAFDVEVGVVAGVVGARLGFSFGQLVDFLAGWFGADIAGDDTEKKKEEETKEDEPGEEEK